MKSPRAVAMLVAVARIAAHGARRCVGGIAVAGRAAVANLAPRRAFASLGGGPDEGGEPEGDVGGEGAGSGVGRGAGSGLRRGRPFLDPRAPRRQESIRSDPKHAAWGGMIDILEHNAYQDAQREEDADGWFFDGTKAENDRCANCPAPLAAATRALTVDPPQWLHP